MHGVLGVHGLVRLSQLKVSLSHIIRSHESIKNYSHFRFLLAICTFTFTRGEALFMHEFKEGGGSEEFGRGSF